MSFLSQLGKGLATGFLTGSTAGGLTAFSTNSMFAGFGVGMADNAMGGWLSHGVTNAWAGNYGWGGFYGNNYGYNSMGWGGADLYSNCNSWGW